jgi:hypothetical protein
VAGEFVDSGLRNSGETLNLEDADNSTINDFTYDDGGAWPGRADGSGSSLEVVNTEADYDDPENWRSSSEYNGTPGAIGVGPRTDVVVNEVLSNTDDPSLLDAIELHNTTGADIDVGSWYVSDSNQYKKFRIPGGTVIPAGEYLVLDEDDFNPAEPAPDQIPFALDGTYGDDVWLLISVRRPPMYRSAAGQTGPAGRFRWPS